MSCWIRWINSGLIRWRGLMPLALRRFSEYWRYHARCFSAQVAQRVCPCMAGWLQRQSPCSLRSWWVRAGFLGFDGRCFAEGGLGCRRGEGFDRLDLGLSLALGFRFGMNTVSTNNCGLEWFIPACAGRNYVLGLRVPDLEYRRCSLCWQCPALSSLRSRAASGGCRAVDSMWNYNVYGS